MTNRFDSRCLLGVFLAVAAATAAVAAGLLADVGQAAAGAAGQAAAILALPAPRTDLAVTLDHALRHRRSVRDLADRALSLAEVGQMLWAGQGVTDPRGLRTAPSAGATYPLEIYLVAGHVVGLDAGVYRYLPASHGLAPVAAGDVRGDLAAAAAGQRWLQAAPAILVVAAVVERTELRYGARAVRYVDMEAGAAVQNVLLQCVALGLGGTFVGAFDDAAVERAVRLAPGEGALAIVPVGHQAAP
ncbi:MAG TPA: SagB/ThcOx family dehydrogenase [Candidatus Krumholzibacteria bacterium]|nr:SagB/ThcOx family dehydrogenase [Candidatus Krumholzibacteria bacterium]HPD70461.1 SagB/ThcOx family dehydrogenase [Candidatus Krumholzibacteria bacterium]HRY39839.1 SagB/ThcOx family dehydrogenase [Candidatus Krumholzibacteria bacterium]